MRRFTQVQVLSSAFRIFGVNGVLTEIWAAVRARTVAYVLSCVRSYFAFIGEYGKDVDKGCSRTQVFNSFLFLDICYHSL